MRIGYLFVLVWWLICFTCSPLHAQNVEQDEVEEQLQEEAESAANDAIQDAASSGSPSDTLFSFGILYTLSIDESESNGEFNDTAFFPRLSVEFGFDNSSLELEVLSMTFPGEVEDGFTEVKFNGLSYSVLGKFGAELQLYGGYGLASFDITVSETSKGKSTFASLGLNFEQKIDPQSGTVFILGGSWGEELVVNVDYRQMTLPVESTTTLTDLDDGTTVVGKEDFDFKFTFLLIGVSYYF